MSLEFALVGNQNCGKTTLFNRLTKNNRRVGNFPGVTVEKAEGEVFNKRDIHVVDLPGIYSLCAYTDEEKVSIDYILNEKPDLIINVVDASNIERNLYLTLSLLQLEMPVIIVLSMVDELIKSGAVPDVLKLSQMLGVTVVYGDIYGIIDECVKSAKKGFVADGNGISKSEADLAVCAAADIIKENAEQCKISKIFAAKRLLSDDEDIIEKLGLSKEQLKITEKIKNSFLKDGKNEFDAAAAKADYETAKKISDECIKNKPYITKRRRRSLFADKILTNKFFAVPIFFAVMLFVFYLTFASVGEVLSQCFDAAIEYIIAKIQYVLTAFNTSKWLTKLVIEGICTGIGSVVSFMPSVLIMFLCLSVLEDCGYMARIVFIFDKAFRKIGISGRSMASLLLGFGCSVPAIMSTRTLFEKKEKFMTIMLVPFMSCGAKVPVYLVFVHAFFPDSSVLVMALIYISALMFALVSAGILKKSVFKGESGGYIMELPPYRIPRVKNVILNMRDRAKDFFCRTFAVIFLSSVIIWALQSLDMNFDFAKDISDSLLSHIAKFVSPIFIPLGFGNMQAASALISGVFAKETVISTLAVASKTDVQSAVCKIFAGDTAAAGAFLTFVLLYMPCVASIAAMRREMGKTAYALCAVFYQTCFAYVCALAVRCMIKFVI